MQPLKRNDMPAVRHHVKGALQWNRISPQLLTTISDLYLKLGELDQAVEVMVMATSWTKSTFCCWAR